MKRSTVVCPGCGELITAFGKTGRPRKWCSERCRKTSYAQFCIDCGKRTTHGSDHARVAEPRCNRCAQPQRVAAIRARWADHRAMVERMWAEGRKCSEIAAACGIPTFSSGVYRAHGYDLPHRRTPEQRARIKAGRWAAKA